VTINQESTEDMELDRLITEEETMVLLLGDMDTEEKETTIVESAALARTREEE
jgi:hypothetical protein